MSESRRSIILITRNLPPLIGGMERLNLRLLIALQKEAVVSVVGPEACASSLPRDTLLRGVPLRPLTLFILLASLRAAIATIREQPSWLVAGSGLVAPLAVALARLSGGRSAVYVHGLDLVVAHWLYRLLWIPCIRRANVVIANSANTAKLAISAGVPEDRVCVVNPGTDLPRLESKGAQRFRERHRLGSRPILLSVGRLTARKGIRDFVSRSFSAVLKEHPEAVLVVIGDDPRDALFASAGSGRDCVTAAAFEVGVQSSLLFLSACSDHELDEAYAAANVHLFPILRLAHDVEGFGMVAVEAAARGLPTVAFACGGVADAIVPGTTGELVDPGDYEALARATGRWLVLSRNEEARVICAQAARRWSWERFSAEILFTLGLRGPIQA